MGDEHRLTFQLASSNGLGFMIEYSNIGGKRMSQSVTFTINDEAVCTTAPATPGMLIIHRYLMQRI